MPPPPSNGPDDPIHPISRQQGHCLDLVCQGQTNQEIAGTLHLSLQTVKNHVTKALHNLAARNRTHAALLWLSVRDRYIMLWAAEDDEPAPAPLELPQAVPPETAFPTLTPEERFWMCVDKRPGPCSDADGCWLWRGPHRFNGLHEPTCQLKGLSHISTSARRIAYALVYGSTLPPEIHLRRDELRCPSLYCVQPEHMLLYGAGQHPEWRHFLWGREYDRYMAPS